MTYAFSDGWLRELGATARRDRLLQATFGFYVVVGLVLPRLDAVTTASRLCNFGMMLFVLASFAGRRVRPERPEERVFWRRMALAYLCWTAGLALPLVPAVLRSFPGRAVQVTAFSLVYVFMIHALEGQPHRDSPPRRTGLERLLTWPSVTFFVLGLMIYFVFIPLVLDWQAAVNRRDEFYFYTLLDLYLAVRFLLLSRAAPAGRWRSIYAALALPWLVLVFVADFSFLAMRTLFVWPLAALPVWWLNLSPVFQVLANGLRRTRGLAAGDTAAPTLVSDEELSFVVSARTLALGVAFPVLHIAVTRLDLVVAPDHRSRPALVLIWLIFFGLVAVIRHRHLERSAQQLWLDRVSFEEELRSSEQDLRLMIEKDRAAQMLQASEKKIDFAFRSCPYPLVISSRRDGRFLDVNQAFEETFGYGRDEVVGQRFDELGLWLDPEHGAAINQGLGQEREIRQAEVAFRRKTDMPAGEERRALLSAAEITLQEEPCLLSIVYDVTEQARSLEKLEATVQSAEESGMAIFEIDAEGRIRSWSRGAVALCGWSEAEALGKRWSEIAGLAGAEAMAAAETPEWSGRFELMTRGGDLVAAVAWSTTSAEDGSRLVVARAGN